MKLLKRLLTVRSLMCRLFSYHLIRLLGRAANINTYKGPGKGAIAKRTVKEVLKVVVGVSDAFPPLKSAAAGLLEIFDRYDVCLLSKLICCPTHCGCDRP
jgi:hypothetical protein